jgi:hypothetical protein
MIHTLCSHLSAVLLVCIARLQQTKCTATGFVIAPLGSRRILTNAHAVANQVAVKVRKHGSAQKFNARVLAVGHEVSRQDVDTRRIRRAAQCVVQGLDWILQAVTE